MEVSGHCECRHSSRPHSSFADADTHQHETFAITEVAADYGAKTSEKINNQQKQIKALDMGYTVRKQQLSKTCTRSRSFAEIFDDGDSEATRSAGSSDSRRRPKESELSLNISGLIQHFDAADSVESEEETSSANKETSGSFKMKSTFDINSARALFERSGAQFADNHKRTNEQTTPTDHSARFAARRRTKAKDGRSAMNRPSPTRVNEACSSEVTNADVQEGASPTSIPTPPTASKTPMQKKLAATSFASPITPSVSSSTTPGSTDKFLLPGTICDEEGTGEDEIQPQNAKMRPAVSFSKKVKVVPVPREATDSFDSVSSSDKMNLKDLFDSMQLSPHAATANSPNERKKGEPIDVVKTPVCITSENTMFDEDESVTCRDSPYGELAHRPRCDTTQSKTGARTAPRAKSFAHVSNNSGGRRPGAAKARPVKRTTRPHGERNRSSIATGPNGRTTKRRSSAATPALARRGSTATSAGRGSTAATTSARRGSVAPRTSTRRGSVAAPGSNRRGSTAATVSPQRNQGVRGTRRNTVAGAVGTTHRGTDTGEGPWIARSARTQAGRVRRQIDAIRSMISADGLY